MSAFKTAAVFSSNMVLQRDCLINIFGEGENGKTVSVVFGNDEVSTRVRDGKWLVKLPPRAAGTGFSMTVSCGSESRTFTNVAVGEVWLAGGQSNMELELQNCKNGRETLEKDTREVNVRFYYTQKKCYMDEDFFKTEAETCWSEFDGESAKCWSAVGYFFARDLAQRLDVVVGVIGCNWGGTSASYWMSRESLSKDADLKTYLDEYDAAVEGRSEEELAAVYQEYVDYDKAWNERAQVFYGKHPDGEWSECLAECGENKYPGPLCPMNPFHATALYESMVKRVCPYTIKGFIYYQGETDDNKPRFYYKLFRELIRLWRDDWEDQSLTFLFAQLPMHRYKLDTDWKHWCLIREAQMKVYQTVKNTGIAVILDLGEFNEIHPKDKQPVGERLALQAMYQAYGDKSVEKSAFSPMYKSMQIKNGGIELAFEHCDGFTVKGEICGFEIAGEDKEFKTAEPTIIGDRIFISSDEVKEPLYARYNWTNYGPVTVYGVNGLPLAPFRTSPYDEK